MIKYKKLKGIFDDENNILKKTDSDIWKHRSWIGFGTLVVYAVKYECFKSICSIIVNTKHSTWRVLSQDRNLTELAGICTNGGICGLMR